MSKLKKVEYLQIEKSILKKACEHLHNYWDEGPCCEGWQSKELISLIADIELLLGVDPKAIWREY